MRNYPKELKDSITARMLPPNNVSVPELVRETGIPKDTLYTWRNKARKGSAPVLAIASSFYRVLHEAGQVAHRGKAKPPTLQRLGVMPSFSRPSVNNDNPYSESLFKTLKYHPGFPDKPFDCIENARGWVAGFRNWYNEVHHHSALKFVTPGQRHLS